MQVFGGADEVVFFLAVDKNSACPADAPCGTHAWLHILIGSSERVGDSVVMLERIRLRFGRIKADGDGGGVAPHPTHQDGRRVGLPEVEQTKGQAPRPPKGEG